MFFLKQTIEPRLPFLFQNKRLSPGSRLDFKANGSAQAPIFISKQAVKPRIPCLRKFYKLLKQEVYEKFWKLLKQAKESKQEIF